MLSLDNHATKFLKICILIENPQSKMHYSNKWPSFNLHCTINVLITIININIHVLHTNKPRDSSKQDF